MISFEGFFNTLIEKNITTYHLIYKQVIHANTIQRMKNNKPITTKTLDTLCTVLDCDISDIIKYTKDDI